MSVNNTKNYLILKIYNYIGFVLLMFLSIFAYTT